MPAISQVIWIALQFARMYILQGKAQEVLSVFAEYLTSWTSAVLQERLLVSVV